MSLQISKQQTNFTSFDDSVFVDGKISNVNKFGINNLLLKHKLIQ